MKFRTFGEDAFLSVRLTKNEWEEIKLKGNKTFENRSVGYMQVIPNNFHFSTTSPFFKEMKVLDDQDKEKSDEEIVKEVLVSEEIKTKNKE